jgi:solute carrier family 25 oxoglutarate transporter 11
MAATCFVQPLDLVKNRMQIMKLAAGAQRPSSASVIVGVVKNEGFATLYTGLSAGLLRQATYTTTRLGQRQHQACSKGCQCISSLFLRHLHVAVRKLFEP